MTEKSDWKEGVATGSLAGIFWGWIVIAVNYTTGAFAFEFTIIQNLFVASVAGGLLGALSGLFLSTIGRKLPFKSVIMQAVFISTSIWLTLRITGFAMTYVDHHRYHPVMSQSIQGLLLSVVLGCILGVLWRRQNRNESDF